jgi:DNA-binding LytR/AlgR family response regulator
MSALLDKLVDGNIVRSHRSFAINLDRVKEIRSSDSGQVVKLDSGRDVPLSRRYRDAFKAALAGSPTEERET